MRISYVSCLYSKRAALTRSLVSFFTNGRFVTVLCGPLVQQPNGFQPGLGAIPPKSRADVFTQKYSELKKNRDHGEYLVNIV